MPRARRTLDQGKQRLTTTAAGVGREPGDDPTSRPHRPPGRDPAPGWLFRRPDVRRPGRGAGVLVVSPQPSMLPRTPSAQGAVSGAAGRRRVPAGTLASSAGGAAPPRLGASRPGGPGGSAGSRSASSPPSWWSPGSASTGWQNQQRDLVGMEYLSPSVLPPMVGVTLVVFGVLFLVGRLVGTGSSRSTGCRAGCPPGGPRDHRGGVRGRRRVVTRRGRGGPRRINAARPTTPPLRAGPDNGPGVAGAVGDAGRVRLQLRHRLRRRQGGRRAPEGWTVADTPPASSGTPRPNRPGEQVLSRPGPTAPGRAAGREGDHAGGVAEHDHGDAAVAGDGREAAEALSRRCAKANGPAGPGERAISQPSPTCIPLPSGAGAAGCVERGRQGRVAGPRLASRNRSMSAAVIARPGAGQRWDLERRHRPSPGVADGHPDGLSADGTITVSRMPSGRIRPRPAPRRSAGRPGQGHA